MVTKTRNKVCETKIWLASGELQDYFFQLGGSGKPNKFEMADMPIYIILRLLALNNIRIDGGYMVKAPFNDIKNEYFIQKQSKIDKLLSDIDISILELLLCVKSFYEYSDKRLVKLKQNKTKQWVLLKNIISEILKLDEKYIMALIETGQKLKIEERKGDLRIF